MLRRDFETFFFGTAIFVTHKRGPGTRPQVIKQKPRVRVPVGPLQGPATSFMKGSAQRIACDDKPDQGKPTVGAPVW